MLMIWRLLSHILVPNRALTIPRAWEDKYLAAWYQLEHQRTISTVASWCNDRYGH